MMIKKWVLRIFAIIVLLLIALMIYSCVCYSTLLPNESSIILNCASDTIPLLKKMPSKIQAPKNLEKEILVVLNRYPEIANIKNKISFVRKDISTTMATQPAFNINIFNKKKRSYKIIINKNTNKSTFNYDSLESKYKIAWISHEFGHIIDYENRNAISLLGMGINYILNPRFKQDVEKFACKSAVYHGFGEETYQSTVFAFHSNQIANSYKNEMKKSYINPENVLKFIENYKSLCNGK